MIAGLGTGARAIANSKPPEAQESSYDNDDVSGWSMPMESWRLSGVVRKMY